MSDDNRKPIIGKLELCKDGMWRLDRLGSIADHLIRYHLEEVMTRDGGWGALYRDPMTGLFWESAMTGPDYHGGAFSLFPISLEDIRKQYKLKNKELDALVNGSDEGQKT